jgi:integrative and conjugative element protein (TIGR02256 family)
LVPKQLRDRLMLERAANLPAETGGYLMGRRRGKHLEALSATFQGPEDIATWRSFDRADPGHTTRAVEVWRDDKTLSGIIGDWHSHPGPAAASSTDEHAWRTLARSERAPVVGLIVGEDALSVYIAGPRYGGIVISHCRLVEETDADLVFMRLPK